LLGKRELFVCVGREKKGGKKEIEEESCFFEMGGAGHDLKV
jgi:hypothetical protein